MSLLEADRTGPVSIDVMLRRLQAIAGATFSVFVLMHLANILLAPLGPATFNAVQAVLRQVYQQPVIEVVFVMLPLLIHLTASVWRLIRSWRRSRPLRARLHLWAGLFLVVFIFGHIAAVRGPSLLLGIYPGFEGLAFSIWFAPWYFYPYYFLLALAGFYHATFGLVTLARRRGIAVPLSWHGPATLTITVLIFLSLLSFGGILVDVGDPTDNDFARLAERLLDTRFDSP